MENPYDVPVAPVIEPRPIDATYDPSIFSLSGRIGRLRYLAYSTILVAIGFAYIAYCVIHGMGMLASGVTSGNLHGWAGQFALISLGIPFFLLQSFAHIVFAFRRFTDTDNSGWLALLTLVPVIAHLVWFFLILCPGSSGSNRYGPAPSANPPWVAVVGIGLPLVLIGAVIAFVIYVAATFFAAMH